MHLKYEALLISDVSYKYEAPPIYEAERRTILKVYVVANQKGGIGKTTTATALAASLNEQKYKTLLIDADPQGNSTDTYRAKIVDTPTLYDVLLDREDPISLMEAVQHTEAGDIVASDPALKEADTILPNDGDEYFLLKDALEKLKGYEYVVIDTAPADNKLLKNCLIAANEVIIPVTADRYGIQGLADLNRTIVKIQKRNNPSLRIAGLLLVRFDPRLILSREVKEFLEKTAKEDMNTILFQTTIRESTAAQKAQAARENLIRFSPSCTTARDYENFVYELLTRGESL